MLLSNDATAFAATAPPEPPPITTTFFLAPKDFDGIALRPRTDIAEVPAAICKKFLLLIFFILTPNYCWLA